MKKLLMVMTALTLLAMMVVPASAAKDWQLYYANAGQPELWDVGGITWAGFYTGGVEAGAFGMQATHLTNSADNYNAYTYCMDGNFIANGDGYERVVGGLPASDIPNPNNPVLNAANWGRIVYLTQTYGLDSLQSTTKSAGFQLAIWEILNDTGSAYDLGAGAFIAGYTSGGQFTAGFSSGVMDAARTYLGYIGGNTASSDQLGRQVYFQDGQNQIEVPSVPEPMSMALGLMGLSTLAGYAKLRRRKA